MILDDSSIDEVNEKFNRESLFQEKLFNCLKDIKENLGTQFTPIAQSLSTIDIENFLKDI